jgi:hypothetical protein
MVGDIGERLALGNLLLALISGAFISKPTDSIA